MAVLHPCQLLLIACIVFTGIAASQDANPTVQVPGLGTIVGLSKNTPYSSRSYAAFIGIPYAETIQQETRFQPSKPAPPFKSVFNATKPAVACRQSVPDGPQLFGTDKIKNEPADSCLALTVYTHNIPSGDRNLSPVIVYIHGGAYISGNMASYTADHMMEEDVVMVTIQYRLGPTGFLCLQVPEIPGNAGLYDQTLALQWVNKHISAFGGDPTRVTINGHSAGGCSVSLLAVSEYSNQYFRHVIAQSGSALQYWTIDADPVRHAVEFAAMLNCTDQDHSKLAACLLTHSDDEISRVFVAYSAYLFKEGRSLIGGTCPCVQQVAPDGYPKLLDKHPIEILNDPERRENLSRLKVMFGSTKTEGSFFLALLYFQYLIPNNLVNNSTFLSRELVSAILHMVGIQADSMNALGISIMDDYLTPGSGGNFTAMAPGLIDMTSVFCMKAGNYRTMQLHSEISEGYWYSFDYEGEYSQALWHMEFPDPPPFPPGVTHGEDLIYQYISNEICPLNDEEMLLARKLAKLWANFVIFGNPTPEDVHDELDLPHWKPYSMDDGSFLRILTPREFSMETNYPSLWHITRQNYSQPAV